MKESPIIFYHYFDLTDTDQFCDTLIRRFRETGHTRKIEFREWNCYEREPGRDGDLFSYDCLVMSALAEKGYIRQLPDIIDTSGVFDWVMDTTLVKKKRYAIPLMACCNVLICRREDAVSAANIYELEGKAAVPFKSMIFNYYLEALCTTQDPEGKTGKAMERLWQLMGGDGGYDGSQLINFDGASRFLSGECRYLIGFTEHLRLLPRGDYVVRSLNLSEGRENELPLLMVDAVSMGAHVKEEKMLDCLDLMEIIVSEDFQYQLNVIGGKPQYMMPADRRLYPKLMELDPIYQQIYDLAAREVNCATRYGPSFYEKQPAIIGEWLEKLRTETV